MSLPYRLLPLLRLRLLEKGKVFFAICGLNERHNGAVQGVG